MSALEKQVQRCRCPEALYWTSGDIVLIGKGARATLYIVIAKESAQVALIRWIGDDREEST